MTFFFERSIGLPTNLLNHPPLSLHVHKKGHKLFHVADLVYIEAEVSYSQLYWLDEQPLRLGRPMKYYQNKLPATWFIRIHRNFVVNRRFVERIDGSDAMYWVHLSTGLSLPIARRRWRDVCQQLMGESTGHSRSIQASFYTS